MDQPHNLGLAELEPTGFVPATAGLQQRKSSETRIAILDAAVECLAEHGYARTTTQLIAKVANVSRGAMLHHYATKQELIESVIEYAFYRHVEQFIAAMKVVTERQRTEDNAGIRADWQTYQSREFMAYLELNVAARTDAELRDMYLPRARKHDRVWRDELLRVFPEWTQDLKLLNRSRRLVQALMTGMVINRAVWDDASIEETLLKFLADILIKIRKHEIDFPQARAKARAPGKRRVQSS